VNVYLGGRKLHLEPSQSIGKGGEADVYDIGAGRALKLFKPPEHPDLGGDTAQQQACRERLEEHQRKLRAFPGGLPDRVVRPEELVTSKDGGRVLGYTMRLLQGASALVRYGEPGLRRSGGSGDEIGAIFRDLHATVAGVHRVGVVIGDFSDLNVLVCGRQAHLIDADSFQFGPFLCRVFSERFVDPLLCDPAAPRPLLSRPHNTASDWYAYNVMLLRSLLCVDPYGGVLKADGATRVAPAARPLHRITVFDPRVRYPRPALRWDVLPDDLLQHFRCVFERDVRVPFPLRLLADLRWTSCSGCGEPHTRGACPRCTVAPPAAVREVLSVRGAVRCERVFRTPGTILEAALQDGRLQLVVHEGGRLRREDGRTVLSGDPPPGMRFRISGARTLVGHGHSLALLGGDGAALWRTGVEGCGSHPAFDANGRHAWWIADGQLLREGRLGPERIGAVLPRQTLFWVGPQFGFGFYRAGALHVSFVFDALGRGLNDSVGLPALPGQLLASHCTFGDGRCWLLTASHSAGRTRHRCAVVSAGGSVLALAEAEPGDGSWLQQLDGACAGGPFLLVPTDDGVVRVEVQDGRLLPTRLFADSEPFVDAGCRLLAGPEGLHVVDRREVRRLQMA
jgi:hypothetical protein